MTANISHFNKDALYLARKDELSEGGRYGYLRALADMHTSAPCEWQLAMLNVSILGADGELVDKPRRCAELIEEHYRSVHERLVAAKRQLADMQPRMDALVAALRDVEWVTTPGEDESHCPSCEAWQHTGHAPTCDIAAALKLAGEPPKP